MQGVDYDYDYEESARTAPSYAVCLWGLCAALLVGPSVLVWIVRLAALGCEPGPGLCHGLALGGGLRDTLALAWVIGSNTFLALLIALISAVLALSVRKPLLASMGLLLFPISAVLLPIAAVYASMYDGCQINEDGIGDCVLWGAKMGMSFHEAAVVASGLSDTMPYSIALALMVGVVAFVFFRPKPAR
jgi:hypothetical protein